MELNPRVVFERMFGGDGTTAEARRARLEQSTSILDAVASDVRGLEGKLGARDRARLDEYLANVREVERRIVQAEDQRSERRLEAPPTPSGIPDSFEEHVNLMFELQALAFQGDLTRVTSFMMGRELSGLRIRRSASPTAIIRFRTTTTIRNRWRRRRRSTRTT